MTVLVPGEQGQPDLGLAQKTRRKIQAPGRLETTAEQDPPVARIERRMLISIRSMPSSVRAGLRRARKRTHGLCPATLSWDACDQRRR